MISLPNFKMIKVIQREKEVGDIPSALEWLLKYHQVDKEVNAPQDWNKDLQEKIVQRFGKTTANFTAAINALTTLYPCFNGKFIHQSFIDSQCRCVKIKKLLDANRGCIISLVHPSSVTVSRKFDVTKLMFKKEQGKESTKNIINANFTIQTLPVVGYTAASIILLDLKRKLNDQKIIKKWADLEWQHNPFTCGNDLCFLEKLSTKDQSTLTQKRRMLLKLRRRYT